MLPLKEKNILIRYDHSLLFHWDLLFAWSRKAGAMEGHSNCACLKIKQTFSSKKSWIKLTDKKIWFV